MNFKLRQRHLYIYFLIVWFGFLIVLLIMIFSRHIRFVVMYRYRVLKIHPSLDSCLVKEYMTLY